MANATGRKRGHPPTLYRPEYVRMARVMSLEGLRPAAMARVFGVAQSTLNKWQGGHPEFRDAMNAGREETGKIVVALAKRARGFSRKTVKPMVVGVGNGRSEIIDHPVIEYFPPDVKACLEWLKRHSKDIWGEHGAKIEDEAPVTVPAHVLRMLSTAAATKREGVTG